MLKTSTWQVCLADFSQTKQKGFGNLPTHKKTYTTFLRRGDDEYLNGILREIVGMNEHCREVKIGLVYATSYEENKEFKLSIELLAHEDSLACFLVRNPMKLFYAKPHHRFEKFLDGCRLHESFNVVSLPEFECKIPSTNMKESKMKKHPYKDLVGKSTYSNLRYKQFFQDFPFQAIEEFKWYSDRGYELPCCAFKGSFFFVLKRSTNGESFEAKAVYCPLSNCLDYSTQHCKTDNLWCFGNLLYRLAERFYVNAWPNTRWHDEKEPISCLLKIEKGSSIAFGKKRPDIHSSIPFNRTLHQLLSYVPESRLTRPIDWEELRQLFVPIHMLGGPIKPKNTYDVFGSSFVERSAQCDPSFIIVNAILNNESNELEYEDIVRDSASLMEEATKILQTNHEVLDYYGNVHPEYGNQTPHEIQKMRLQVTPDEVKKMRLQVSSYVSQKIEVRFLLNGIEELGNGKGPKRQYSSILWEHLIEKSGNFVKRGSQGDFVPDPLACSVPTLLWFKSLGMLYYRFLHWHKMYLSKGFMMLPLSPTLYNYLFSAGKYRWSIKDILYSDRATYDQLVDTLIQSDEQIEDVDPEYEGNLMRYVETVAKKHFKIPSEPEYIAPDGMPHSWAAFKDGFVYAAGNNVVNSSPVYVDDEMGRFLNLPKMFKNDTYGQRVYFHDPWMLVDHLYLIKTIDRDKLWNCMKFRHISKTSAGAFDQLLPYHDRVCCKNRTLDCSHKCTKMIVCRYISSCSDEELAKFVWWITGERQISSPIEIEINETWDPRRLPMAMTCSKNILMPDYALIKEKTLDDIFSIVRIKFLLASADSTLGMA